MKKIGIGELSRNGGFNGKFEIVKATGEPLLILRKNEPFVIVYPIDETTLDIHKASSNFVKVMQLTDDAIPIDTDVLLYLHSQVLMGAQAEAILYTYFGGAEAEAMQSAKTGFFESVMNIHNRVNQKNYTEEVVNAGEQTIAPGNEKEGVQSVSPNLFQESNPTFSSPHKTPPRRGVRKVNKDLQEHF